jgi:hypothetical protein
MDNISGVDSVGCGVNPTSPVDPWITGTATIDYFEVTTAGRRTATGSPDPIASPRATTATGCSPSIAAGWTVDRTTTAASTASAQVEWAQLSDLRLTHHPVEGSSVPVRDGQQAGPAGRTTTCSTSC